MAVSSLMNGFDFEDDINELRLSYGIGLEKNRKREIIWPLRIKGCKTPSHHGAHRKYGDVKIFSLWTP
jgi:hypothetical protein